MWISSLKKEKKKKKSSFLEFSILLKPHRAISKTKQKTHSKTYQTRHQKKQSNSRTGLCCVNYASYPSKMWLLASSFCGTRQWQLCGLQRPLLSSWTATEQSLPQPLFCLPFCCCCRCASKTNTDQVQLFVKRPQNKLKNPKCINCASVMYLCISFWWTIWPNAWSSSDQIHMYSMFHTRSLHISKHM